MKGRVFCRGFGSCFYLKVMVGKLFRVGFVEGFRVF